MLNQNAVTFSVVAKSNQGVLINGTPADLAYLEPILVNNVIVAPPGSPISLDASYQFGRKYISPTPDHPRVLTLSLVLLEPKP